MKKYVIEFIRRGFISMGFGPIVLAVIYLILHGTASVTQLGVYEAAVGILSLSALAFIAGGLNVLYQVERLPLAASILIHGVVLYATYLSAYLLNGWLLPGKTPLFVFTLIFIVGYLVIWGIIYFVTRRNTKKINAQINKKTA